MARSDWPSEAATTAYVDSVASGLDIKPSVLCATTANITLSGEQTLDGIITSASRVLVKNQTTPSGNGIYVSGAGTWSRAADMDAWTEVPDAFVFVERGTLNADTGWVCTSDAGGTIGSTAITWSQFSGAGSYTAGTGLALTGTQFAIDSTVATLSGVQTLTNKTLTAPTLTNPALGTPASGVLTNASGLPLTTGVTGILPINTGGTGQVTAPAAFDALAPATTRGDLIFRSATTNTRLAAAAAGYLLQTNGIGTDPTWSGFLQSGTGATARTWNSKSSDFINAKDFGATGNGTTDDASAINAALAAALAGNIGTVYLTAGTYRVGSFIVMKAGVRLLGDGLATVTQANGANLSVLVSGTSANGATLENVIVDGNRSGNTDNGSVVLVHAYTGNDLTVKYCTIQNSPGYLVATSALRTKFVGNIMSNCYGTAIGCFSSSASATDSFPVIHNNQISGIGRGMLIQQSNYGQITGNTITGTIVGGRGNRLTVNTSGSTVTRVSGPTFSGIQPGMFFVVSNGLEFTITAVTSTTLTVSGTLPTLSGAAASAGSGDLIGLIGSSFTEVSGNILYGCISFGAGLSQGGLSDQTSSNVFQDNEFSYNGKNAISVAYDGGTGYLQNTSIIGNKILNPGNSGGISSSEKIGIIITSGTAGKVIDTLIDGNTVQSATGDGQTIYWLGTDGNCTAASIRVGVNYDIDMVNQGIVFNDCTTGFIFPSNTELRLNSSGVEKFRISSSFASSSVNIVPAASGGAALGTTALQWSNLFLASGSVINFANGDVTITHSSNVLAFGGAALGYTFDSLAAVTSTSASALAVGANGATNPVLKINASTASVATGLSIAGAAAAGRVAVAAISSGTDEGLSIDAKGAGTVRLGAASTGAIEFSRNAVPTSSGGSALGTTSLMWSNAFLASGAVINFNNGDVTITHSADALAFAGAASGYSFDSFLMLKNGATTTSLGNDAGPALLISCSGATSTFRLLPNGNDIYFQNTVNSGNIYFTGNSAATLTGNVIMKSSGTITLGAGSVATSATAGGIEIQSCAGTPTGAITPTSGMAYLVYDSTNNKLYSRSGGSWRSVTFV